MASEAIELSEEPFDCESKDGSLEDGREDDGDEDVDEAVDKVDGSE